MNGFLELFSQYDVLGAFLVNIELTLWSALFSMILGVILVVMRISPISSLRTVAGAYVELFKNLPLTIIMVFMVLGAYALLRPLRHELLLAGSHGPEPVHGRIRMRIAALRY